MLLDLSKIPVDDQARFDTIVLKSRLGIDEEDDEGPLIPDSKLEQELQTIAEWIVQDKLDIYKMLAKYSNPRGEISSQDLMMFIKQELSYQEIDQVRTNLYIRYITNDSSARALPTSEFLDTLRRLNPQFDDYAQRSKTAGGTGSSTAQGSKGFGKVTEVLNKDQRIVAPSSKIVNDVYERLVAYLEEKNISFSRLTGGATLG